MDHLLDMEAKFVYHIHMRNETETKKPLTQEEVQNTLQEFREAVELIRTRGTRASVYGVPSTKRNKRK